VYVSAWVKPVGIAVAARLLRLLEYESGGLRAARASARHVDAPPGALSLRGGRLGRPVPLSRIMEKNMEELLAVFDAPPATAAPTSGITLAPARTAAPAGAALPGRQNAPPAAAAPVAVGVTSVSPPGERDPVTPTAPALSALVTPISSAPLPSSTALPTAFDRTAHMLRPVSQPVGSGALSGSGALNGILASPTETIRMTPMLLPSGTTSLSAASPELDRSPSASELAQAASTAPALASLPLAISSPAQSQMASVDSSASNRASAIVPAEAKESTQAVKLPGSSIGQQVPDLRAYNKHHPSGGATTISAAPVPPRATQVLGKGQSGVGISGRGANANLNELMDLLGNSSSLPSAANPPPRVVIPPSNQHLQNAHPQPSRPQRRTDISAELEAVLATHNPAIRQPPPMSIATRAPNVVSRPAALVVDGEKPTIATQSASTASRPRVSAPGEPAAPAQSAQGSGGRQPSIPGNGEATRQASVTREQVILGHFCRHAIKILNRVMEGLPDQASKEAELRSTIKVLWTQWVRGAIAKQVLLERVSDFVRRSTPGAQNVSVTDEFRQWYQHQLQLHEMSKLKANGSSDALLQQNRGVSRGLVTTQGALLTQNVQVSNGARPSGSPAEVSRADSAAVGGGTSGVAKNNRVVSASQPTLQSTSGLKPNLVSHRTPPVRAQSVQGSHISQPVAGVGGKINMAGPAAGPVLAVQQGSAGRIVSNNQSGRLAEPAQAAPPGPMVAGSVPQIARTPQTSIPGGKHAAVPVQHAVQGAFVRTKPSQPAVSAAVKRSASTAIPTTAGLPGQPMQPPLKKPRANPKPLKKATVGAKASIENNMKVEPVAGQKGPVPSVPSAFTQPISGRPPANGHIQTPGVSNAIDVPKKAPRKVDDDLDIVGGIVDIEGEEDMLVAEGGIGTRNVGPTDYDSAMLLDGEALRRKIGNVTARLGLSREVSTETMEIISLAARERLLLMLEESHEIAIARTDSGLSRWRINPSGPNICERMQQQRDQEERSLLAQVAVRSEKAARAAAKAAESTADAEKSAKEAAATAEAKKKEQARQEKDKLADVTQKSALAKLVGSLVMKKSKPKGNSSGVASNIGKGSSSAAGRSAMAGNASQGPGPASSAGPSRTQSGSGDRSKTRDAVAVTSTVIIDLEAGDEATVDPANNKVITVNDPTVFHGISSSRGASISVCRRVSRPAITLSDCIHFMEREPRSRKSNLLYFWYPRLGTKMASALALPKK
jgi:hypothetical protein